MNLEQEKIITAVYAELLGRSPWFFDLLCDRVMKHMISGVSKRNYEPLLEEISGGTGLKTT